MNPEQARCVRMQRTRPAPLEVYGHIINHKFVIVNGKNPIFVTL